ncbi:MAG TPA: Flp pilus assembly protein CpaB [Roseiarcus sp.]|nr:Flp pilus assembly protein CpaB [Roseiarcus sp.]
MVAVILGAVAAFLARSWLQSHSDRADADQTVSIVVANRALAFGASIAADDVKVVAWPAKSRPQGAFADFAELVKDGRRIVLSPFVSDEPIIASKVSAPNQRASLSTVIEKGKRAVTVAVDDVRGVAGFIFPGDFVDVVLTRTNNSIGPQDFAEVILQHVKVLAIDQMAGERQERPTVAKAVTVEVSPEQALKILLATNVGKLSLILRQPAELAMAPDAKVTDRDLFGADAAQASAVVETPRPPPPGLSQVAYLQRQPPAPLRPPPPPLADPATRKITIVRSVKSEQYEVPRESR